MIARVMRHGYGCGEALGQRIASSPTSSVRVMTPSIGPASLVIGCTQGRPWVLGPRGFPSSNHRARRPTPPLNHTFQTARQLAVAANTSSSEEAVLDSVVKAMTSGKIKRVLFISGAGLSADSGLPTYRGVSGLYEQDETEDGCSIEDAISGQYPTTP